jgi:hypothetical protein
MQRRRPNQIISDSPDVIIAITYTPISRLRIHGHALSFYPLTPKYTDDVRVQKPQRKRNDRSTNMNSSLPLDPPGFVRIGNDIWIVEQDKPKGAKDAEDGSQPTYVSVCTPDILNRNQSILQTHYLIWME